MVHRSLSMMYMVNEYDMRGNRIHHASMEAGERWMLSTIVVREASPACGAERFKRNGGSATQVMLRPS